MQLLVAGANGIYAKDEGLDRNRCKVVHIRNKLSVLPFRRRHGYYIEAVDKMQSLRHCN